MISPALLRPFRLLIALVLLSLPANATHLAGADMNVKYIGTGPTNLLYRVTLNVYSVCEPGSSLLYTAENITFTSAATGLNFTRNVSRLGIPDTITYLCPSLDSLNSCRSPGSPYPGATHAIYTDTFSVPFTAPDLTVTWEDGSRNLGVTNIVYPAGEGFHVSCVLNTAARYNNNTPKFLVGDVNIACANQPGNLVTAPSDVDNDSLVVTNTIPLSYNSNPIAYTGTFSLSNPIASSTGYTVSTNGTASFTPTATGKFALAFKVLEYDRPTGLLLSTTSKEVELIVTTCNVAPPSISRPVSSITGGVLQPDSSINAHAGQPLSFAITGSSALNTNHVSLTAAIAPAPGATFTVTANGTANPTGTFSWTPPASLSGMDVTVSFVAKDSTCTVSQPMTAASLKQQKIHVLPATGIVQVAAAGRLSLYPNPAADVLYISGYAGSISSLKIISVNGTTMSEGGYGNGRIRTALLAPGFYLLKVTGTAGAGQGWFIKQ